MYDFLGTICPVEKFDIISKLLIIYCSYIIISLKTISSCENVDFEINCVYKTRPKLPWNNC